ncbi:TetR/AcrR family transcriptional regulator [Aeromicrobium ginsengisoli]|uniref:TetR/AcrR family transcriptional regulator n=1 Tax=Aeromicrobium ginsengisoli TaxID=363867 RepID=A0A5M4FFE1_9ACTN|nr:TetR/AcrR family transcriptional regulator [Aeromicrobium ginsengisoli]KAA1397929.1 TetR/AcrR family transcriptional regulator [Aeromicrobium ginsengisoli]
MATGSRAKNRTSKAEQASATRRRIVEAASALFVRDGFVTTTMATIAKEAGVAVQTLYMSFGSKTAILQASFDHALSGAETTGILETDWFQQVLADPDGAAALGRFCQESARVIASAAPLFDVMRAAAADPEVGDVLAHNKKLRYDGFRLVVEALASRQGFDSGLSSDDAHGILYAVLSEDTYLLLVTEHGWSHERWISWVNLTCSRHFFPTRVAE